MRLAILLSGRGSELVAMKSGDGDTGKIVEEIIRVEDIVPQELEHGALQRGIAPHRLAASGG